MCESDDGEDCSVCPKDCGTCPLEDWHYGLITASILFIFILIGVIYGVSFNEYDYIDICIQQDR